jgi:hypothetical protein
MHYKIWLGWVIGFKMNAIIVLAIHAGVHHENGGFNRCAFAGLEYHRTDG